MTTFPAKDAIKDAIDQGIQKTNFENWLAGTKELPGGTAETELTIASGSVTTTGAAHSIDTESDAATDNLTNIDQSNHPEGRMLVIHSVDAGRIPTVKHAAGGTGQILLADSEDLPLDDPKTYLILIRKGTTWEEITRTAHSTKYSINTISQSLTSGSGPISYTGIGFRPKLQIYLANINASQQTSIGFTNASVNYCLYHNHLAVNDTWSHQVVQCIHVVLNAAATNTYSGKVTSFDSDGMTITWNRSGGPTGTLIMQYISFG